MDCGGDKLTLQVGAIQDAVMLVPPTPGLLTVPLVLTAAIAVFDELQVNVGLIALPAMSNTLGTMVEFVPLGPVMVFPPVPLTDSEIVCTGHVRKDRGALVVSAIEAVICVNPGVWAVTWTCPLAIPLVFSGVNVATVGSVADQLNGPTVDEMSTVG